MAKSPAEMDAQYTGARAGLRPVYDAVLSAVNKFGRDVEVSQKGIRLEAAGSFNAMLTHRVRVSTVPEVEKELIGWLKRAYDAA
jgi:hypothetical protein